MTELPIGPDLNSGERVWQSDCWSDWDHGGSSATTIDESDAKRPYLHWHLAVELATPDADDVRRGSVIQKLWNAIEARVNMLREEYQLQTLKKVHGLPRKIDTLELLDRIGLARPLILRQLKAIRNSVEHQDRGAPGHAECLTYIDSVWYFLRSTDIFSARRITSFDKDSRFQEVVGAGQARFVEFDFGNLDWKPTLRGKLPASAITFDPLPHSRELVLTEDARPVDTDTIYIAGRASKSSPALWNLVQDYFFIDFPDSVSAP